MMQFSGTSFDKKDLSLDVHFKWLSIRRFLKFSLTISTSPINLDIYSKTLNENVTIMHMIAIEMIIGMSYMFMDMFIKQYTRRCDLNSNINPLLRGIAYGSLLQSAMRTLLTMTFLLDVTKYLSGCIDAVPTWLVCLKEPSHRPQMSTCISVRDALDKCRGSDRIHVNRTAVHHYYEKKFMQDSNRNVTPSMIFLVAFVWIINFCTTTMIDKTYYKLIALQLIMKCLLMILLTISAVAYVNVLETFNNLMEIRDLTFRDYSYLIDHVSHGFGVGFVGVYDFDTMSPYTMTDNAVVIFTIVYTGTTFVRSFFIKCLYNKLSKCLDLTIGNLKPHYLIFVVLPLSVEFYHVQKLWRILLFLYLWIAFKSYISLETLIITKVIHSEFKSVKNVYIVGILCFLGFVASLFLGTSTLTSLEVMLGLFDGVSVSVVYLASFKVGIIMWVYGIRKFETDIQFWLGFKPTQFWIICWMMQPVLLGMFAIEKSRILMGRMEKEYVIWVSAVCWIIFTFFIVTFVTAKIIMKFMVKNNFLGLLNSNSRYGPPSQEARKQRKLYSPHDNKGRCIHDCMVIDEWFDCNHVSHRMDNAQFSLMDDVDFDDMNDSLRDIYQASTSREPVKSIQMSKLSL